MALKAGIEARDEASQGFSERPIRRGRVVRSLEKSRVVSPSYADRIVQGEGTTNLLGRSLPPRWNDGEQEGQGQKP